jgi:hypothetical protein
LIALGENNAGIPLGGPSRKSWQPLSRHALARSFAKRDRDPTLEQCEGEMLAPAIRFSSRVVVALALTGAGRLNYP